MITQEHLSKFLAEKNSDDEFPEWIVRAALRVPIIMDCIRTSDGKKQCEVMTMCWQGHCARVFHEELLVALSSGELLRDYALAIQEASRFRRALEKIKELDPAPTEIPPDPDVVEAARIACVALSESEKNYE